MNIQYHFLKALFWLLSKIPFWFYHVLSRVIGFLLIKFKIYRYKLVVRNINRAFPEKSEKEVKKIAHKFFYHFSDLLIESLKAFNFSKKKIKKRYKIHPNDDVQRIVDEGRSLAIVLPHFANWEWAVLSFVFMVERNQPFAMGIYKPLKNKVMDRLIKESRTPFPNALLIPKKTAMKEMMAHSDKPFLVGFAADQSPANVYNSYWMEFMGVETGVFFGVEKMSKKMNLAVVYAHVRKTKRSFYEVDLELITEHPNETDYGFITEKHMKLLEADLKKTPHLWLWTHNRWKRKKPSDFNEKIEVNKKEQ